MSNIPVEFAGFVSSVNTALKPATLPAEKANQFTSAFAAFAYILGKVPVVGPGANLATAHVIVGNLRAMPDSEEPPAVEDVLANIALLAGAVAGDSAQSTLNVGG